MSKKALKFAVSALLPILEHSEQAPGQVVSFDERCDPSKWVAGAVPTNGYVKADEVDASKLEPSLYFVKDDSVYMMSCGTPGQVEDPTGKKRVVEYAQGFNPTLNPDWYDEVLAICGGDDFAQKFDCKSIREQLAEKPTAKYLCIQLKKRSMDIWVD